MASPSQPCWRSFSYRRYVSALRDEGTGSNKIAFPSPDRFAAVRLADKARHRNKALHRADSRRQTSLTRASRPCATLTAVFGSHRPFINRIVEAPVVGKRPICASGGRRHAIQIRRLPDSSFDFGESNLQAVSARMPCSGPITQAALILKRPVFPPVGCGLQVGRRTSNILPGRGPARA